MIEHLSSLDFDSAVWAFGGGKGGVGKSLISISVASYLAFNGYKVILIDGDLGAPNLHTLLGVPQPKHTLTSFINHKVETLEEVLLDTLVPGLKFIAGAGDMIGLANPKFTQKQRLLRNFNKLKADVLILDLGAGTSYHVLDLFNSSVRRVVVLTPDPTALQNAYAFIKIALYRELLMALGRSQAPNAQVRKLVSGALEGSDTVRIRQISDLIKRLSDISEEATEIAKSIVKSFHLHVVVNMANAHEGKTIANALDKVAKTFLSVETCYAGHVKTDPVIAQSVRRMRPYLVDNKGGKRWDEVAAIVENIINKTSLKAPVLPVGNLGLARPSGKSKITPDENEEDFRAPSFSGPGRQKAQSEPDLPLNYRKQAIVDDFMQPFFDSAGEFSSVEHLDRPEKSAEEDQGSLVEWGLNESVVVRDVIFQVQSEDLGWQKHEVLTIVYSSGQIVFSRTTPYSYFHARRGRDFSVNEMVIFQHRAIISGVKAGKLLEKTG